MPLYVYCCPACKLEQEHLQRIDEEPPCLRCETRLVPANRRVPSVSFVLERSVGWDGWERVGPGLVGRTTTPSKHIGDAPQYHPPENRKALP